MVAHFIPIFFGLYKDAMDNYQNRDTSKVPAHWLAHFKASQESKVSMTGAQISIETGSEAHIQGDMAKAFVLAYKTFVSKYCPDNPPPLEYFHESFLARLPSRCFLKAKAIYLLKRKNSRPARSFNRKNKNIVTSGIQHILCLGFGYSIRMATRCMG